MKSGLRTGEGRSPVAGRLDWRSRSRHSRTATSLSAKSKILPVRVGEDAHGGIGGTTPLCTPARAERTGTEHCDAAEIRRKEAAPREVASLGSRDQKKSRVSRAAPEVTRLRGRAALLDCGAFVGEGWPARAAAIPWKREIVNATNNQDRDCLTGVSQSGLPTAEAEGQCD